MSTDRSKSLEESHVFLHDGDKGSSKAIFEVKNSSRVTIEQQQLASQNEMQQTRLQDLCVPQLIAAQAATRPEAVALVEGERVICYGKLDRLANQLACYLRSLGVQPNIPVGLYVEQSPDLVIGLLGILKAGGAYLPLDPSYPPDRLSFMLEDAQIPILITQSHLITRLPARGMRVICLDTDKALADQPDNGSGLSSISPNDLAYIIYTSGSTGHPKGVQITHRNLLNLIKWHQATFAVTSSDRATQLASPAFDAAGWELWPYLTIGATVCLVDEDVRTVPQSLQSWLINRAVTVTFVPTALAETMITREWPASTSLRIFLTGSDTLRHYPSPGLPFAVFNNYGPTETTVVATSGRISPAASENRFPPIGKPIAHVQIYILDEHLRQVPEGEVGELYIGGAGVGAGYLNRAALTAERFIPHPFSEERGARLYKTGDQGCFLPDGQIRFLGRNDHQIKLRGYRIEPDEIVALLNRQPGVQASIVVARENTQGEKLLVAYLVPASQAQLTRRGLYNSIAKYLPHYMIPTVFVILNALPLTPNGKIDRAALPEPGAANILQDDPVTTISTETEQRLTAIVCHLLGLASIELDDNFFLLGGHSLLGTQIITEVAKNFGVGLPLRTLFEHATIRKLSAVIDRFISIKHLSVE